MKGFDPKFRDFPDYILGITHEIWEGRGIACDNGFIREPDGYGCVQWTSCYSCGGTGEAED